ncbi:hypothetical protein PVAND_013759 [Polypedilum vanderplanki]|uniref:Uncharacterized protein n=1 Tax=Polypedilum vanderplanki TaxID=319348 RepID=A0A9J6CSJ3_POLVA|nr:hypothetical protein PVAND_013759 [Polypedilum vanderplanki]
MASQVGKTTLKGLLMRGWNEIPEVLASGALGLFGIGLATVGVYRYYKNDGDNRRYKMSYVVYRPEDPRAARVHKD